MATETVSLRIDIDHRTVDEAAKAEDKLTTSTEKTGDAIDTTTESAGALQSALADVMGGLGDATKESEGFSSSLGDLPLGKVASKAGVVAGAVIAVGTAMVAAANFTREAARSMNEELLGAIEDVARGSEAATQNFELLENTMRNLRGRTAALALGFDTVEAAAAQAEETFIANEAVVATLDSILPDLQRSLAQAAIQGFRFLAREAVEANEALIETQLVAERARTAMENVRRTFGEGEGIGRVAGLGQAIFGPDGGGSELASGLELVIDGVGNLSRAQLGLAASREHSASLTGAIIQGLESEGRITAETAAQLLTWRRSANGADATARIFVATLEELDFQEREHAAALDQMTESQDRNSVSIDRATKDFEEHQTAMTNLRKQQRTLLETVRPLGDALLSIGRATADGLGLAADAAERNIERIKEGGRKLRESLSENKKAIVEDFGAIQQFGSTALSSLGSSFSSFAAEFGASLTGPGASGADMVKKLVGDMLVTLGSAATAIGTISLLGTLFPAIQVAVGPSAAAPALIGAGLAAVTVGSALGASVSSARPSAAAPASSGGAAGSGSGTVNNFTIEVGAGLPRRAMDRAFGEAGDASVAASA